MLEARTIGGLIALAAGALALLGVRAANRAGPERRASLARSARIIGLFLLVWLARDLGELLLTRVPLPPVEHAVDIVCMVLSTLLAAALLLAGRAVERASLRAALAVLATLTALGGLVRMSG